jgi:transposase
MGKLREVLRLSYDAGLPQRAIAQACGIGLGTVTAYLQRATAAGFTWPLPDDLDDTALEARLFVQGASASATDRVVPDWHHLHQELKRAGVTLALLWHECSSCRKIRASGSGISQITAATVSRWRRWRHRTRLWPSTTT